MVLAEQFGGLEGLWDAQRDAEVVDSNHELAAFISSGTLDSPWANPGSAAVTLEMLPETEGIVNKLNSLESKLEEIDG